MATAVCLYECGSRYSEIKVDASNDIVDRFVRWLHGLQVANTQFSVMLNHVIYNACGSESASVVISQGAVFSKGFVFESAYECEGG